MPRVEKKIVVRRGQRSWQGCYWIGKQPFTPGWALRKPYEPWMVKGLKPGQRRTITMSYPEDGDDDY